MNRHPYVDELRVRRISSGAFMAGVALAMWLIGLPAFVWLTSN